MNEMFGILYNLVSNELPYRDPLKVEDFWSEDLKKDKQKLYELLETEKNKHILDKCLLSLINICDNLRIEDCKQCLFIGMMIGMDFKKFVFDMFKA